MYIPCVNKAKTWLVYFHTPVLSVVPMPTWPRVLLLTAMTLDRRGVGGVEEGPCHAIMDPVLGPKALSTTCSQLLYKNK